MPLSEEYIKHVVTGSLASGQTWSLGLWTLPTFTTGYPSQTQVNSITAALDAYWATWWTAVKPINGTNTTRTGSSTYVYLPASTAASLVARTTLGTPVAGTGTGNPLPTTVAMVASLRTDRAGRSGRGRCYTPATAAVLVNNQFSSANCATVSAAYKALINSINSYSSPGNNVSALQVVVLSRVHDSNSPVTSITVNSRPDSQRPRGDKVTSFYSPSDTIP